MSSHPFSIRPATSQSDAAFIVAAFDSSVKHLSATGNADHWGTQPFSSKPGFLEETQREVSQSEVFRQTGIGERLRVFIAQVEGDVPSETGDGNLHRWGDERGKTFTSVGAMTIRDDEFASHINDTDVLQHSLENARQIGFVFIDVILTDFRIPTHTRQGAGAASIQKAKDYASEKGKKTIYVDCWTGGTGKLVPYYENLGFTAVQDYHVVQNTGKIWPARFFRLDLPNDGTATPKSH